jgi:hypothetical protein
MPEPSPAWKWGSIVWALLIGGVLVILAGSILLPSTKRGRVNLDRLREYAEEETEMATTAPAHDPAPAPAALP